MSEMTAARNEGIRQRVCVARNRPVESTVPRAPFRRSNSFRNPPMSSTIRTLLKPHEHDVGGLMVRRVLPALAARTVGPFIFFDHIGPATLVPGKGLDVRPHPHIGLATVTY